jgi:hypothetical protein
MGVKKNAELAMFLVLLKVRYRTYRMLRSPLYHKKAHIIVILRPLYAFPITLEDFQTDSGLHSVSDVKCP